MAVYLIIKLCVFLRKSEFFLVKSCFYLFFVDKSELEDCNCILLENKKLGGLKQQTDFL